MQLYTATFVKNKYKFLTILLQRKLGILNMKRNTTWFIFFWRWRS